MAHLALLGHFRPRYFWVNKTDNLISRDLKQTVREINDTFRNNDINGFLDHCTEDVRWMMMGDAFKAGKEAIRAMMDNPDMVMDSLTENFIIADGDRAVCEGRAIIAKKDGSKVNSAYCDVYRFRGGKVAEMWSYFVALPAVNS